MTFSEKPLSSLLLTLSCLLHTGRDRRQLEMSQWMLWITKKQTLISFIPGLGELQHPLWCHGKLIRWHLTDWFNKWRVAKYYVTSWVRHSVHTVQSPTSLLQLSIHATDTIKQFGFWYEILKQSQWNEKGSEVQLFSVHAAKSQVPWSQTKWLHYCYHYSLIIFPIIIKAFPTWILSSSLFSSALFFFYFLLFSFLVWLFSWFFMLLP